jgi:hypothetical protein
LIGIDRLLRGRGKFVDKLPDMSGDDAPPYLDDRRFLAAEPSGDKFHGFLRTDDISTREDINRRVSILGPGMDREVRFGDHDHAAHAERFELVEGGVNDCGLAGFRRGNQDLLDNINFFQQLRATTM